MPESETHTKGEMHGCVVCGKLYDVYAVYDAQGKFVDCKVMSLGAKRVPSRERALVACEKHSDAQIQAALDRTARLRNDGNG